VDAVVVPDAAEEFDGCEVTGRSEQPPSNGDSRIDRQSAIAVVIDILCWKPGR